MDTRKNYEELGMAIVEQAAMDYHNARFFLETEDLRSYKDTASKNSRHNTAKKTLVEIERFFHSEWFKTVCPDLDGKKAFEALKETYDREVRDDKMEKFMRNRNN